MVYKLYLKDKYGKKTLLAKSENKDLIEKAKHEYDTREDTPIEYTLLYMFGFFIISTVAGMLLYTLIEESYAIILSAMIFIVSLISFALLLGGKGTDGITYIVWED